MVREQEPPKAPLIPAKQNLMCQMPVQSEDRLKSKPIAQNEPQFGVPSPLRQTPQSFSTRPRDTSPVQPTSPPSTDQSLYHPALNQSFHPPPFSQKSKIGPPNHVKPDDRYSDLFIRPKKPVKPAVNPLLQARKTMAGQQQQQQQQQLLPAASNSDDDVVEIPQPSTRPAFAARTTKPPMFSSQPMPPKPINNFIDLTSNLIGMTTNNDLFHDRFGAADPRMYMDSGKATEDIKALLEGAFEDDEDKPRTRQGKKRLNDDLVAKLEGLKVKGVEEEAEPEEEDDEGEDDGTVEGLKVKLLPHQIEGVDWMREKELGMKKTRGVFPRGGILADDMGLGKTIQSIALILTNPKPSASKSDEVEKSANRRKLPANLDKGTLVVAPLALIKQWEGEIRDRVEDSHALRVCVHHGPQRAKGFKELKKYDVVITTYHTLVSEYSSSGGELKAGCFGLHWYRVILDEAHSIKNRNAKATKAACALNAEYRWCLTGTPMQNNLDELQSLIHFLRIKPYDNLNNWREQITRPMNNGRGGLAIRRLQVYLKAFMKRRTKDILKQEGALRNGGSAKEGEKSHGFKIVKRTVEAIEVDFTPKERSFYERLESRTDKSLEQMMAGNKMSYASALVLLLRLRQACNHANLIKGDLAKERDAFVDGSGSQTPSRKKAVNGDEMDSIAAMLGGLSVATKRCDVCQIELSSEASASGAIRCDDCEADLDDETMRDDAAEQRRKKKAKKDSRRAHEQERARRKPRRKIVTDSDDDEDEDRGEWIVSEQQQSVPDVGKAGGFEDENAEGGGESIGSTSEDDEVRPARRQQKSVNQPTEEDDEEIEEEEEEEEEDDNNEISSPPPTISSKIQHLLGLLHHDCATHKYIIFSFFTSMLDQIEPFLRRDRLVYTRYDGSMRNDLREASLHRLRSHAPTRILLCSLRAGSLGLNLTAASRVVILEPFWNPVSSFLFYLFFSKSSTTSSPPQNPSSPLIPRGGNPPPSSPTCSS
jgi:SNF2 family DNA or RNA helicase